MHITVKDAYLRRQNKFYIESPELISYISYLSPIERTGSQIQTISNFRLVIFVPYWIFQEVLKILPEINKICHAVNFGLSFLFKAPFNINILSEIP
jgi:hypothetical protein